MRPLTDAERVKTEEFTMRKLANAEIEAFLASDLDDAVLDTGKWAPSYAYNIYKQLASRTLYFLDESDGLTVNLRNRKVFARRVKRGEAE